MQVLARAFLSKEREGTAMLRELGADYVLVSFGGCRSEELLRLFPRHARRPRGPEPSPRGFSLLLHAAPTLPALGPAP